MRIEKRVEDIVKRVFDGELLGREQVEHLLRAEPHSPESGFIIASADILNRQASGGRSEVHAQIGLNCSPCSCDCSFCAFASKNRLFTEDAELDVETILSICERAESQGANALFTMATGNYPFKKFIEISEEIRRNISADTVMIANVGDFSPEQAKEIKSAGYRGIYHAVRMGEGRDTSIPVETRLETVKAARGEGLLIGTCVEPVGPEHSVEEISEKILIGRDLDPCYSGAMRRVALPGTEMEKFGMLTEYRASFLVAVVRLAMGRRLKANCTHEPNLLGAAAGANIFWAEVGANPRDTEADTADGRGHDIRFCLDLFKETDYEPVEGPSVFYDVDNSVHGRAAE